MRRMNSISINQDGQTAQIEGGVISKEVTESLLDAGKWTSMSLILPFLFPATLSRTC